MKNILLSRKKYTLIDDNDFQKVNKFKWFACPNKHIFYAARNGFIKGKRRIIYMHRQLLGIINSNKVTDHIDGNGLNNTRTNLRICSQAENVRNNSKIRGKNPYKGITKVNRTKPWLASIQINRKHIYLGLHKTAIEAARAYNKAALKHHGKFAKLNEIYKNAKS